MIISGTVRGWSFTLILVFTMSLPHSLQAAEFYKWTDENGVTHYGKQLPAGVVVEKRSIMVPAPAELPPTVEQFKSILSRDASGHPTAEFSASDKTAEKPVVIYTTEWCPVCKRAKAYLQRRGIKYVEYDVEKTAKGREDYQKLGGKGVPIILVGDQRLNGFRQTWIEQRLQ